MSEPTLTRLMSKLPTLEQWLDREGDGSRADGYDAWSALEDLIVRELARQHDTLTDDELSFLRMWRGFGVAIVEICNLEHGRGRSEEQILRTMPRALGAMTMYAAASALSDETPWRSVAKLLSEEMKLGAKIAADHMTELESPNPEGERR